jgi:uncharacterized protein YuzE
MNGIVFFAIAALVSAAPAPPVAVDNTPTHDGTVISAAAGQLTMADAHGKPRDFKVTDMARITKNGMPAQLDDLEAGDAIRVTVDEAGRVVAISTRDADKENARGLLGGKTPT